MPSRAGDHTSTLSEKQRERYRRRAVKCFLVDQKVESLADYVSILDAHFDSKAPWWFRGHSRLSYRLIPSALRYQRRADRRRALGLMADFRRVAALKHARPPEATDELGWQQVGQHYGLPTQLLDWTENALAALYFSCNHPDDDGLVFVMNPITLNRANVRGARSAVLDAHQDENTIGQYFNTNTRSLKPAAVNPVWNSERIIIQKGTFTLHPWLASELQRRTPSLVAIPIPTECKRELAAQLRKVGVDKISLFPELEHAADELKLRAGLEEAKLR